MDKSKFKLELITPVFVVTDVQLARDFYTEKLGFDVAFEWADDENSPIRYVSVQKNDRDLHLTQSKTAQKAIAYLLVRDIEDYYVAVKESGANITQGINDLPWGMREFEVADPDGNRLIFGQDVSP